MPTLIITEKPNVAERIANSLFFRKENAGEKKGKSLRDFYRQIGR